MRASPFQISPSSTVMLQGFVVTLYGEGMAKDISVKSFSSKDTS